MDGLASCFAVLPDGRVVLDNSGGNITNPHNIFSLLKTAEGLPPEEINRIQEDFREGRSGDRMFDLGNRSSEVVFLGFLFTTL